MYIGIIAPQFLEYILVSRLRKTTDNAMHCKDDMCFLKSSMGADSTIFQDYFNCSSTSEHLTNTFLLLFIIHLLSICFAKAVIGEASRNKIPDDERDKISALPIDIVMDPKI